MACDLYNRVMTSASEHLNTPPLPPPPQPVAVIMAKWPEPGQVKTRLISPNINPTQAAAIAAAALECITLRLSLEFNGRLILAVSPDVQAGQMANCFSDQPLPHPSSGRVIPQGSGDLGDRIKNVWLQIIADSSLSSSTAKPITQCDPANTTACPIAFFGIDSPDIPTATLRYLHQQLTQPDQPFDLAAGPTTDGGYWVLAARNYHPEVLHQVQWGGESVFETTKLRATQNHLNFLTLPQWYDIDEPADLTALQHRLLATDDVFLQELRLKISTILNEAPPSPIG